MHWQRGRGGWRDGFNQSLLLRLPAALRQADLEATLQVVIDHHDALRLRVMAAADGELRIAVLPVGAVDARACLRRVDVVGLDETSLRGAMLDEIGGGGGSAIAVLWQRWCRRCGSMRGPCMRVVCCW